MSFRLVTDNVLSEALICEMNAQRSFFSEFPSAIPVVNNAISTATTLLTFSRKFLLNCRINIPFMPGTRRRGARLCARRIQVQLTAGGDMTIPFNEEIKLFADEVNLAVSVQLNCAFTRDQP